MKEYKVVSKGFTDTSQVPKGKELYYHCTVCDGIIPSSPKDNVGCKCRNIFIDIDYLRLSVRDFAKFEVVKK